MKDLELQKYILERHLADDFPLLKKDSTNTDSIAGFDSRIFSSSYGLVGLVAHDCPKENIYLPHFEFNVETYYSIGVPESSTGKECFINSTKEGLSVDLKAKDNSRLINVTFPYINNLFQLRNLEDKGMLLSIPQIKEDDCRDMLSINENQIHTGFTFMASSTSYGQYFARMDINHPDAEGLIKEYLGTIDRRFADYKELKKHFREEDDKGNILWEDQNLQSRKYNSKRNKLHKALFGDLTKLLKKGNIKFKN